MCKKPTQPGTDAWQARRADAARHPCVRDFDRALASMTDTLGLLTDWLTNYGHGSGEGIAHWLAAMRSAHHGDNPRESLACVVRDLRGAEWAMTQALSILSGEVMTDVLPAFRRADDRLNRNPGKAVA